MCSALSDVFAATTGSSPALERQPLTAGNLGLPGSGTSSGSSATAGTMVAVSRSVDALTAGPSASRSFQRLRRTGSSPSAGPRSVGGGEIRGRVGEHALEIDLVARRQRRIILQEDGRLLGRREARPAPDDVAAGGRVQRRQADDRVALPGHGLRLDLQRLALDERRRRSFLPGELAAAVAADLVHTPEGFLPGGDLRRKAVDVALLKARAQAVQRKRRLSRSQRRPEDRQVLGVQLLLRRDRVGVRLVAVLHERGEVGLRAPLAILGVDRQEVAEREGRLVGPVALRLRGREAEAVRQKHDVVGDLLGRVQVLAEQGRRHDERVAGVREAFARGAVRREIAGGLEVDAGQVADRVVVLGVAEAADDDAARVAGAGAGFGVEHGAHPGGDRAALLGARLGALLRRHLAVFQVLDDHRPGLEVALDRGQRRVSLEVEVALLLLGGMTSEAVLREDGLHAVGVVAGKVGVEARRRYRGQQRKDEQGAERSLTGRLPTMTTTPLPKRYTVYYTRRRVRIFTLSGSFRIPGGRFLFPLRNPARLWQFEPTPSIL